MKEESDLRGDRGTRMLGKDDAFTRRELVLIEQWLASQNNTSAPNRSTDKKQRTKKKNFKKNPKKKKKKTRLATHQKIERGNVKSHSEEDSRQRFVPSVLCYWCWQHLDCCACGREQYIASASCLQCTAPYRGSRSRV